MTDAMLELHALAPIDTAYHGGSTRYSHKPEAFERQPDNSYAALLAAGQRYRLYEVLSKLEDLKEELAVASSL